MKRHIIKCIISVVLCLCFSFGYCTFSFAAQKPINVGDFVAPDSGVDVSSELQRIIDENPNKTLFFPDGEYLVSAPLYTPANPSKSVDLQLSTYTIIKASENFSGEAVIALGGKDPFNDIKTPGSNYSLTGGIIDCSGIATGVAILSGRETKIQNTSIKNAVTGIYIGTGANSGSSDSDIRDVDITGTEKPDCVGVLVEGHDNTFTNMRIGGVYTGFHIKSGGNSLYNIHPLFYGNFSEFETSVGFYVEGSNNTLNYCYSDQFCTAYRIGGKNTFDNCFCMWWTNQGEKCTVIQSDGRFDSVFTNLSVSLRHDTDNTMLKGTISGSGTIQNLMADESRFNLNHSYKMFMSNSPVHFFKTLFTKFINIFKNIYYLMEYKFIKAGIVSA
ncbi:MAG: glycoside hydrolase family 55 protein [Clostridia bacterium]|nr:glycoside hydrolase family 55 protein [Clostridia bacterium]